MKLAVAGRGSRSSGRSARVLGENCGSARKENASAVERSRIGRRIGALVLGHPAKHLISANDLVARPDIRAVKPTVIASRATLRGAACRERARCPYRCAPGLAHVDAATHQAFRPRSIENRA